MAETVEGLRWRSRIKTEKVSALGERALTLVYALGRVTRS